MDSNHRKILRANRVALAKEMDPNKIYPYLIAKDIYKPYMIEDFEAKGSRFDQSNALLSSLETRGPNAFDALCSALEDVQPHLASLLRPSKISGNHKTDHTTQSPYQNSHSNPVVQASQETFQLTVWPDNSKSGIFLSEYPKKSTVNSTDPEEVYKMLPNNPCGVAFILNNNEFESKATPRKGSDIDKENLRHVFSCLGFKVIIKENRRSKDIFYDLEELMASEIKSEHTCMVVILLSYGDQKLFYGSDGKPVLLSRIFSQFNGHYCPEMTGKPKLFFVQTCSNGSFESIDKAKKTPDKTAGVEVEGSDKMVELSQDMSRLDVDATDASQVQVLPTSTDLFSAHSTIPGSWAWGKAERGSWFVEALCEVLLTKSHSDDLASLMTMVNERIKVALSRTAAGPNRTGSLPEVVNMLRKKVYFNLSS